MKHTYFLFLFALAVAACTSPKDDALKKIHAMEQNDSALNDPAKLQELLGQYTDFMTKYPDDPKTEDFVFKAVSCQTTLGRHKEAVTLLDDFISRNPQSPLVEKALFIKAFTYENGLQQLGKAHDLYADFLKRFPNSEFADDARFAMENLGKSAEEVFSSFDGTAPDTSAVN